MLMDVYRLSRDDLDYELLVRGCTNCDEETVVSLRHQLREVLRDETFGNTPIAVSYRFVEQGLEKCLSKSGIGQLCCHTMC